MLQLHCNTVSNPGLRDRNLKPGPNLPIPLWFPCALRINATHIFIAGQSFTNNSFPTLNGFIYDTVDGRYVDTKANFINCQRRYVVKHSCTFLKSKAIIIMAFDSCTLILNLNSLLWRTFSLPVMNGVIIKSYDDKTKFVHYIASYNTNMSKVYEVSGYRF